jgi:hydrogenase maturation protease
MSGILVAGIGNIFQGDDAFGVEVVQRLRRRALPPGVAVVDFGIRGIDLVYALLDGHEAVILVDAAARDELPGTVSVIAVEPAAEPAPDGTSDFSPHGLDPASVLALVRALGGDAPPVFLVACEPQTLGGEEGVMGLSPPVAAAIEPAIGAIAALVQRLRTETMEGSVQCGSLDWAC